MKYVHSPTQDRLMDRPATDVLLVTYVNDSGDRIEYVLPLISDPEVKLIEAFVNDQYPDGGAVVSVVNVESLDSFTSGFEGEFEAFLAAYWKR